ncbi:hypothetical protein KIW84_UN0031 [Lathyrus oleraceus]|nr:hypothetical protein KIW84_UN0031 [Pisum sativum]
MDLMMFGDGENLLQTEKMKFFRERLKTVLYLPGTVSLDELECGEQARCKALNQRHREVLKTEEMLYAMQIGTEHEKFGFELGSLCPVKYEQIAELLNGIAERFDWEKIMEGDNIIGLKQGKQSISLEPGGQFELSGAPIETLHQTKSGLTFFIVKSLIEVLKKETDRDLYAIVWSLLARCIQTSSSYFNDKLIKVIADEIEDTIRMIIEIEITKAQEVETSEASDYQAPSTYACEDITNYYSPVKHLRLKGEALKRKLNSIIAPHHSLSYQEVWDALKILDAADIDNPEVSSGILEIYSLRVVPKRLSGKPQGWNSLDSFLYIWRRLGGEAEAWRRPGTNKPKLGSVEKNGAQIHLHVLSHTSTRLVTTFGTLQESHGIGFDEKMVSHSCTK